MAINWRDVQVQAEEFALKYKDAKDEDKEAKPFWTNLFRMFGISENSIGMFEERVKLLDGSSGKIDYFAPSRFLVEHKSRGKDLDAAFRQAAQYFDALSEHDKPRYVIVSDFARFRVYDFHKPAEERLTEFTLEEFPRKVRELAFLADEKVRHYEPEDPINVRAVRAVGKLYEAVRATNHLTADEASKLLTRLVFCFFADDTGIFNPNAFHAYIEDNTESDGNDIGAHIGLIFQTLDTDDGTGVKNLRPSTIHSDLAALPYVNGGLFGDDFKAIFGHREIRDTLLGCMRFDWSKVSPEIFGSMFQSVMDEKARHDLGAHYTSETNILKVINGLFLDDLNAALDAAKTNHAKLNALWDKLAQIALLDPACGCGNFLVVSYRELRRIELEIIKRLYPQAKKVGAGHVVLPIAVDLASLSRLSIERMYGIEIEAFPAEVARLSLWLMDHMMNVELGAYFGKHFAKLPLKERPHIVQGNALTLDWESVVPKEKLSYILGNPPFLGSKVMSEERRAEMQQIFEGMTGAGNLDYVTAWYMKAAKLMQKSHIRAAFVSTNSISQGEQPGILWDALRPLGVHIQFAHRTFKWSNEATGKAAVYCVIIGFGSEKLAHHRLFEYADIRGDAHEVMVKEINPYLVAGPEEVMVRSRQKPLCDVPEIGIGNKPIDGGMYLFTTEERDAFIAREPKSAAYFRRWIGSDEFINGHERWCLWLGEARPEDLRAMPEVMRRVEAVRQFRLMSKSAPTRKLADTPTRFHVENMLTTSYLLIPRVSSEKRHYIPIGFIQPETISSDSVHIVACATLYHFGVLESEMHMTWTRAVCGRLESRYRYSKDIVYNNFPWPENPADELKKRVEEAAQAVLDARAAHHGATLADLYDPLAMPTDLLQAHRALDRAVDACYGVKKFASEPKRLEFLFERYKRLTSVDDILPA